MKKNNNLFFVSGVIILILIIALLFSLYWPQKKSNTIYLEGEPTTAEVGVYGDDMVLPANESFYLKIEDGHVTDIVTQDKEDIQ